MIYGILPTAMAVLTVAAWVTLGAPVGVVVFLASMAIVALTPERL